MKKLKKLSLKQMEDEMAMLGSDEQRSVVGGSGWEYIDGQWTYMLDGVDVWGTYGSQVPSISTTATYGEWSDSQGNDIVENTVQSIINVVPGLSDIFSAISNKMNGEKWEANTKLLYGGYSPYDTIRFDFVVGEDLGMYYDLYDVNGNFIGNTK